MPLTLHFLQRRISKHWFPWLINLVHKHQHKIHPHAMGSQKALYKISTAFALGWSLSMFLPSFFFSNCNLPTRIVMCFFLFFRKYCKNCPVQDMDKSLKAYVTPCQSSKTFKPFLSLDRCTTSLCLTLVKALSIRSMGKRLKGIERTCTRHTSLIHRLLCHFLMPSATLLQS